MGNHGVNPDPIPLILVTCGMYEPELNIEYLNRRSLSVSSLLPPPPSLDPEIGCESHLYLPVPHTHTRLLIGSLSVG